MSEIIDHVQNARKLFGEQPFLIDSSCKISFNQLDHLVSSQAKHYLEIGINENVRVGLYADNSSEYIISILALGRIKAVTCLMSARYPSVMIQKIARQTELSSVISDRPIDLPDKCNNIILSKPNDALTDLRANINPELSVAIDQLATIMFTSGSSAIPKAVCHSIGNHHYNAVGANLNIPFEPGDRWLLSLPLYHVGGLGLVFRALLGGGAIVIPDRSQSLAMQIKGNSITHLSVVNTQLRALLEAYKNYNFDHSLKTIIVGGGPQNELLLRKATKLGFPIATTYGMTEMTSQITCSRPTLDSDKIYGSGQLLKYRNMKLSESGELLVRGKCLMAGYLTHAGVINQFDTDGWFQTGDRGEVDEHHNLIVLGRIDNMFISGGENIYPEQIEAVLLSIEGIQQVIVVAIKNEKFGQRSVAFVNCATRPIIDLDELAHDLSNKLPSFMIPVRFFPWPQTLEVTGLKPSRSRLKQLAEEIIQSED